MKKRFILVLAAIVCMASMAFASGQSGGTTTASGKPVVTWYLQQTVQQVTLEDMKTISKYAEDKIGVGVTFAAVDPAQYQAMIQTGQAIDLMTMDSDGNFVNWVEMGAMADLTTLLPTVTPALWNATPADLWNSTKYKGKIWAIPEFKDAASTVFILWDTRSVNKYGIGDMIRAKDSSSTASLDKIFRHIKAQEPNFYITDQGVAVPGSNLYDGSFGVSHLLAGVAFDDNSLKVRTPLLDDPLVMADLRIFRQWQLDKLFAPDQLSATAGYILPELGASVVSKGSGWPSAAAIWAEWNHNPDGVTPIEWYTGPTMTTSLARAVSHFVGVNSPLKNEALKIMELACTDVLFRDQLAYGVEGKHFNYTTRPSGGNAGVARLTGVSWEPPAYKTGAWLMQTPSGMKGIRSATISTSGIVDNFIAEIAEQTGRAKISPLMGFTMEVSQELRVTLNNIGTIWTNYEKQLLLGTQDPAVLVPQVMREVNAAGLQTVIVEIQRQIDAWAKTR
jgi:putative aldouronate transport system substrate-binding protein